jgi:hypothetical protein
MERRAKAGIVYTGDAEIIAQITRLLYSYSVTPCPLMPGARLSVDMLIIPDGIGLYPGVEGFSKYAAVSAKPMCQFAELFRLNDLEWYADRDTPLLGIGDGAAMLWNFLGHSLTVVHTPEKGTYFGLNEPTHSNPEYTNDDIFVTSFGDKNIFGTMELYTKLTRQFIHSTITDIDRAVAAINTDTDDDAESSFVFTL